MVGLEDDARRRVLAGDDPTRSLQQHIEGQRLDFTVESQAPRREHRRYLGLVVVDVLTVSLTTRHDHRAATVRQSQQGESHAGMDHGHVGVTDGGRELVARKVGSRRDVETVERVDPVCQSTSLSAGMSSISRSISRRKP